MSVECGCKGVRFCALCEGTERVRALQRVEAFDYAAHAVYLFCPRCQTVVPLESRLYSVDELVVQQNKDCRSHGQVGQAANDLGFSGASVFDDFITADEESELVARIDGVDWVSSQSGRRKQDYGPKVNFKRQKVKLDPFIGMPDYSRTLLHRMAEVCGLADYVPFELCNLEYAPERRSAIEFHMDDKWIWGERLISINLLSGSVMCFLHEDRRVLLYCVMPRYSLLCMQGVCRHEWKHSVLAEHITERRIALTMREPELKFQPNGDLYESVGKQLIERSHTDVITTN